MHASVRGSFLQTFLFPTAPAQPMGNSGIVRIYWIGIRKECLADWILKDKGIVHIVHIIPCSACILPRVASVKYWALLSSCKFVTLSPIHESIAWDFMEGDQWELGTVKEAERRETKILSLSPVSFRFVFHSPQFPSLMRFRAFRPTESPLLFPCSYFRLDTPAPARPALLERMRKPKPCSSF